jgi:hypothetical protein
MTTLRVKTDLRCGACVESIRPLFDAEPGVNSWTADVSTPDKLLTVEGNGISATRVGELLNAKGYRVVGEVPANTPHPVASQPTSPTRGEVSNTTSPLVGEVVGAAGSGGWGVSRTAAEPKTSYYPLLLILLFLLGGTALLEVGAGGEFEGMRAMRHFMAGFFLVFGFFKLLNVPAFADAYRGYDVVAKAWPGWGYVYPFVEVALGAAYLANVLPVAVNVVTLVVMGVSTVGVVQSVLNKRKIRCACLGTVFNLPMSVITIVEDVTMVLMAAGMLVLLGAM